MKDSGPQGLRPANKDDLRASLQIDADVIRELSALLEETGLSEIEIEEGGQRVRVVRQQASVSAPAAMPQSAHFPHTAASQQRSDVGAPRPEVQGVVASPMVGTVYVAPEPGRAPFVQVGDVVREGDTLLIVEAMKTMNPILAPHAGIVNEICVTDAQPVEFGQALMVLSPAGG